MIGMSACHLEAASVEELASELVVRLGGPHAALEQVTAVLESTFATRSGAGVADVNEDTEGYCYLRLFDRVEHRDASEMGKCPTVAEVRRFSNRRADPFGARQVVVTVMCRGIERVAHVEYKGGNTGLRPVAALAALAKDLKVGGLPDGVSDAFPEPWIPADLASVVTWDYVINGASSRSLDVLSWVGDYPSFLRRRFEAISSATSKVRWTVRADPLGPSTATVDVIDGNGKVITVRSWTSYVAHTSYHQQWKVRGNKVFVQTDIWRAAKMLSDPSSPAPEPTPDNGHGDLFATGPKGTSHNPYVVPIVEDGFCYSAAFADCEAASLALGKCPTVESILSYGSKVGDSGKVGGVALLRGSNGLHHAERRGEDHSNFWQELLAMDSRDRVGTTQGQSVKQDNMENVNLAPVLTLRPKNEGMIITVPFVCILDASRSRLMWDITAGQKLAALMSYFESVELVSLHAKVTVHKGDNDTLVSVVADTIETWIADDEDWVGAAHTLHVSGNTNGATSGEFRLEGNHGFGTQLKGLSVGNPTPILQVKLETTVSATAYFKAMLTIRVGGTGIPKAMVLTARAGKGGLNGSAV